MPQQPSEIRPQKRHKIAVDICQTRKSWFLNRNLHHFRSRAAISQGQQSWAVSVGQHLDWVLWPPRPFQRRKLPHSFTHLHAAKMCTDLLVCVCVWCSPPTFVWPCKTSSTSLTLVQISYHTSFYQYGNLVLFFWGAGCIPNFCPNNACKRTSLKFMRLVIKWF